MNEQEDPDAFQEVVYGRKKGKKEQKKMSQDIQQSLKTKRKVTNLLRDFQSQEQGQSSSKSKIKSGPINLAEESEEEDDDVVVLSDLEEPEKSTSFIGNPPPGFASKNPNRQQKQYSASRSDNSMDTWSNTLDEALSLDDVDLDDESFLQSATSMNYPPMKRFEDDSIYYRKLNSHALLLSINPSAILYFSGKVALKVLKGSVEVLGYEMNSYGGKQYALSPKGYSSLLSIKGLKRKTPYDTPGKDVATELYGELVSREEVEDLPGAVVVMEGYENEWTEGMRNFSPDGETLVGISAGGIGESKLPKPKFFLGRFGFQFIPKIMLSGCRLLDVPGVWEESFDQLLPRTEGTRVCVLGGKSVGKSTYTRWMVNKFLSNGHDRVLYVDLDPGQTELTPPGMISIHVCKKPLLGPNVFNLQTPIKSIYLGGTNVSDFPATYLKAIVQLFKFASLEANFTNTPWIINTMGFCQGLGVDIAVSTIKLGRPTSVIQLTINNHQRSYPFLMNRQNVMGFKSSLLSKHAPTEFNAISENYTFIPIESACSQINSSNNNAWGPSPKVLRDNVMMSYFSEMIGRTPDLRFESVVPYSVSLDKVVIGTMHSDSISYNGAMSAINGNLVALCESSIDTGPNQNQRFVTRGENYMHNCFGYGVVRAHDGHNKTIFIVTPVPDHILRNKVNFILAAGSIGLPVPFYAGNGQASASGPKPYLIDMRQQGQSKLHSAGKKYFSKKKVTHDVLRNSLL